VSRISKARDSAVSAQIPHPFVFNQRRVVPATASDLHRQETAVHMQASWVMPLRRRWQIAASGGPTWFRVAQDLVQNINVSQTYDYDTATSAGVIVQRQSRSHLGFNAGVDVIYLFAQHVGVGMSGGYSLARIAAVGQHHRDGRRRRCPPRRRSPASVLIRLPPTIVRGGHSRVTSADTRRRRLTCFIAFTVDGFIARETAVSIFSRWPARARFVRPGKVPDV
jgi:hypothetical protein